MALGGVNDITPLLLHTYKKKEKKTHTVFTFSVKFDPFAVFLGKYPE